MFSKNKKTDLTIRIIVASLLVVFIIWILSNPGHPLHNFAVVNLWLFMTAGVFLQDSKNPKIKIFYYSWLLVSLVLMVIGALIETGHI